MDDSFSSLRIDGGMFSPEFLQRVADADIEVEGCSPADFSTNDEVVTNLRDHLNYLWRMSINVWERFGPSEDALPASRVKGFIQRLMRDLGLELDEFPRHISSGEQPQLSYDLGGSLWHAVPSEVQLDERSEVTGTRRTSPHNLLQGELTSSEYHGWGLLTNGRCVRILRKTNRPSIQESLEFDLEKMFTERLYPDFCLFAMLVHGTRWSYKKENPMDCWLERWYKSSKEEGLSALEDLRECVKQAANAFGSGIIRFSAGNQELRDRLRNEVGLKDELQREIMRFMYKFIFLFVMEDRDFLLRKSGEQDGDSEIEQGRSRYTLGYSTQRHRSKITSIKGDEHHDLFEEVKLIFKSLYKGEPRLALPALGSYLFGHESTPMIDDSTISNTDYLKTLFHLCTFKKKDGPRQRVHWKTLRETELGSIYESLLEFRPDIDLDNGSYTLVSEAENDRKSSGSFYTPSELVDHLVITTIDPLMDEAKKTARKSSDSPEEYRELAIESILKLTVCDPACGSGHFLMAVLERIAMELARIETGEHHPGLPFIRKWKRLASTRCIFGVDLNPLAIELCKVAIWMDTYDGTNPLTFLDGHIRHGNSLLGQRLENMGLIPDDAIPKAWADQSEAHRKFNRDQIKKATKEAETKLKKIQKELKIRSKQGLSSSVELPQYSVSDEELEGQMEKLQKIQTEYSKRKLRSKHGLNSFVELPQDTVSDEELEEQIEQLQKFQTELSKRRASSKDMALDSYDGVESIVDGESDEELKEQMEQLKKAIKDKDTQKLLPPEIVWSTVDLPSVIKDIATQQVELTLMKESTLEEIEEKLKHSQKLSSDERLSWAREVLDASIAMWWWPDPVDDEFNQRMADPPVPLASWEFNRYATWLAYECGVEDDVLPNHTNMNHNFSGEESRFRLIRAHTENIANEQFFYHWQLEYAEVFFGAERGDSMGGISAAIGNPPFLGGAKISGASSVEFANFLRSEYSGKAKTDLAAYFYRLSFDNIEEGGIVGMVATNSIGQGETRDCGLRKIVKDGGVITDVKTDIVWPGDATVTVDLVTFEKR